MRLVSIVRMNGWSLFTIAGFGGITFDEPLDTTPWRFN